MTDPRSNDSSPRPARFPDQAAVPGPAASSPGQDLPESNQSLADRARESTPTAAQTIVPRQQRVPAGRKALWWTVCAFPFVAAFVLQWLPALNGPHLFLGLPVIMWWTCIPCSLLICLFLCIVEFTRTDQDREEVLDLLASRVGDERRAAARAVARAEARPRGSRATETHPASSAPEEAP